MKYHVLVFGIFLCSWGVQGCDGGDAEEVVCVPGLIQPCDCPLAYQECLPDGSGFTPCDCEALEAARANTESTEEMEEEGPEGVEPVPMEGGGGEQEKETGGIPGEGGGESDESGIPGEDGGESGESGIPTEEGGESSDEGGEFPTEDGGESSDEGGEFPTEDGGESSDEGGEFPTEDGGEASDEGDEASGEGGGEEGAGCDSGPPAHLCECDVPKEECEGVWTTDCACGEEEEPLCEFDGDCDSEDACAQGQCIGGECQWLPVENCCVVGSDCDDGNPCTSNYCEIEAGQYSGICQQIDLFGCCVEDEDCSNGDICDGQELCIGGFCGTGDGPIECDDGNGCTDDSCDPETGCVTENNEVSCDDGDACTAGDVCADGTCTSAGEVECSDDNYCTDDSCDPAMGCAYEANALECDDDNPCTENDACADSVCGGGAEKLCDDGNPCTTDFCDATVEVGCVFTNNEELCDDGNACTLGDTCLEGGCMTGLAVSCDDGDACTIDGDCDPSTGLCPPSLIISCDDGDSCTYDFCDDSGYCQYTVVPNCCEDDADCSDGNPCTGIETCSDGFCAPGTSLVCGDGVISGECGEECDDGNEDGNDGCSATCLIEESECSTDLDCADGNPCTDDVCSSENGLGGECVYTNNSGACDDGDICTVNDQCQNGSCAGDEENCGCVDDSDCIEFDDDNLCNGKVLCTGGGQCQLDLFTVVNCPASEEECTVNACDPSNGDCILLIADNGTTCNDGDPCTIEDSCGETGCTGVDSSDCGCQSDADCADLEDGNLCNGTLICNGGECAVSPATIIECEDKGDSCLTTDCEPETGDCVDTYLPDASPCDDGDECSIADACFFGQCIPSASLDCEDDNPCTQEQCDPTQGCVYTPVVTAECTISLCEQSGGFWTECGSGCGPVTCENPEPGLICPNVCVPQCSCPSDTPVWDDELGCITVEQCGEETTGGEEAATSAGGDECEGTTDCAISLCEQSGGFWTECGSGCGPATCWNPEPGPICPAVCVPQCSCPSDLPAWDDELGCITVEQCEEEGDDGGDEVSGACSNGPDSDILADYTPDGLAEVGTGCGSSCFFAGNQKQCIADCYAEDLGISGSCSDCFGDSGTCAINNCSGSCVADSQSDGCLSCLDDAGCTDAFNACAYGE